MKCPECGAEIEGNFCSNCGKSLTEEKPKKKRSKKWIWAVVVVIVIIAIASAGGGGGNEKQQTTEPETSEVASTDTNENQQQEQEQEQEQENDNYIGQGMYKVGSDIPEGEYLIYSNGMSYYQVSKDSSGALDSVISNDNFSNTRYITVSVGQYLEIKNAKMLPASKAEPQKPEGNEYPPGMYKVGKDIAPGEYKVVGTGGMAYLEVAKDSSGTLNSVVTNDNFEGEKYITVQEGQYLKLNNCKLLK